jgi:tetratricopeptide (TPR) repeat protein
LVIAEARFDLIRGDYLAARDGLERCIELTQSREGTPTLGWSCWIAAHAALGETLLALGLPEEARTRLRAAVASCESARIELVGSELLRALALVEAKLGDYSSAKARLAKLLERQLDLGVTGLKLGLSYEALAQIAIWQGDKVAFEEFSRLTAREYRHGAQCPLGARYESLINEALRQGFTPVVHRADTGAGDSPTRDVHSTVQAAMPQTSPPEQRSQKALELVCGASGSESGFLYLVTDERVMHAASLRTGDPPAELEQAIETYLVNDRDRSEMLTTLATGEVTNDLLDECTVQLAGTAYELVLLRHVVNDVHEVAAVAAVVKHGSPLRNPQRPQLLAAVAAQLKSDPAPRRIPA